MHLSEFEFASVALTLVRFTLTIGAGVPENYVLQLALIKLIKRHNLFTTLLSLHTHTHIYIYMYLCRHIYMCVYVCVCMHTSVCMRVSN